MILKLLHIGIFLVTIRTVSLEYASGNTCGRAPNFPFTDRTGSCDRAQKGMTCTYTCKKGYRNMNYNSVVVCNVGGQWIGVHPICQEIVCTNAPKVLFSERSRECEKASFQKTCKYTCKRGYRMVGSGQVVCTDLNFWFGGLSICEKIQCNLRAPEVGNSTRSSDCEGAVFDSVCSYTCKEGFRMIGNSNIKCDSNGRWNGEPPQCKNISCSNAPIVANSRRSSECSDAADNEKCQYTCQYGYQQIGLPSVICQNGRWNGRPPTCERITCPNAPNVTNSKKSGDCDDAGLDNRCSYICDPGFEAIGNTSLRCNVNGQWDRPPVCKEIKCPNAPYVKNSKRSPECDDAKLDKKCRYTCETGFHLIGNDILICKETETWDGKPPTCKEVACTATGILNFGTRTGDCAIASVGDQCRYICNRGYRLQGSAVLICTKERRWDGQTPTCIKIKCPRAPDVMNSERSPACDDAVVGGQCTYTCKRGFGTFNATRLTCNDNGEWNIEPPTCKEIACPEAPDVDNARKSGACSIVSIGDTCSYNCDYGYHIRGAARLTCSQERKWSADPPTCHGAAPGIIAHCITVFVLTLTVCGLTNT